jgi:hypothetical protein
MSAPVKKLPPPVKHRLVVSIPTLSLSPGRIVYRRADLDEHATLGRVVVSLEPGGSCFFQVSPLHIVPVEPAKAKASA